MSNQAIPTATNEVYAKFSPALPRTFGRGREGVAKGRQVEVGRWVVSLPPLHKIKKTTAYFPEK
mgnify:CR=1 FL=1